MSNKFAGLLFIFVLLITSCSFRSDVTPVPIVPSLSEPAPTPNTAIPNFDHIVIVIFENEEISTILSSPDLPALTRLVDSGSLLTQYFAVTHPSMPNYIALIGGDTYGYDHACDFCDIDVTSLPDLIERSGRTWKTYQEDMPSPCYIRAKDGYLTKHNPFIFFTPIVKDKQRCAEGVVPLTQISDDLSNGNFPNFAFVVPNACHSGHNCDFVVVDTWMKSVIEDTLVTSLEKTGDNYLIVVLWDEGTTSGSCCGLPAEAGGHIAAVLVSPKAKAGYQDSTPYSHYSILKTISEAWGLPLLGYAADQNTLSIINPWK